MKQFIAEKKNKVPRALSSEWIIHRVVPVIALLAATGLTFPVIAAGTEIYTVTDGVTSESISIYGQNAHAALAQSSFGTEEFDISSIKKDGDGLYTILVKPKYYVTVSVDGESIPCYTGDSEVSYILQEAGIAVGAEDIVSPSLTERVTEPTEISITRVTRKRKEQTQAIAYSTEERKTAELYIGESRVSQEGINGVKQNTLEYIYHDGVEISSAIVESKIVSEPVTQITETGTKMIPVTDPTTSQMTTANSVSAAAQAVNAKQELSMEATAYSGGGKTASGTNARVGAVAVDPSVIPLGTRLYIPGYGYATAEDTGGAIKGNKIDLYFDTEAECNAFGRRTITVYVLS